jgi:DNA gyrase subunit A
MICIDNTDENILVVSEKGYGKRSPLEDYRETNRGGKGVKTMNITEKTGELIAINNVVDTDDLMIINKSGIIIRTPVADLRVMGRATQGVKLINIRANDAIAAVAKVDAEEDEDEIENLEALENQRLHKASELEESLPGTTDFESGPVDTDTAEAEEFEEETEELEVDEDESEDESEEDTEANAEEDSTDDNTN